jgi:hypothetical protein
MAEGYVPAGLRRQVTDRAQGCCEYCRSQEGFSPQPFSVEHIRPRSAGGETTSDNLALSCQGCNNVKYTKTVGTDPVTGAEVSLFHPRREAWSEHFGWSADGTLVLGLTPIGRAAVEALQLNREALANLRRVLFAAQEHPPADPEPLPSGDARPIGDERA